MDGHRLIGRLATNRSVEALDWEIDLLEDLSSAGLGVPRLVPTARGDRRSGHLIVMDRVRGTALGTDHDRLALAEYLRTLHDLTVGRAQRPAFASTAALLATDRGGDVDLTVMPADAVEAVRAAWAALPPAPSCVVHGDPGAGNVLVTSRDEIVLIDWDEARVDHPWFDLAALPRELSGLEEGDWVVAERASHAWEAAVSWTLESDYAQSRLSALMEQHR